MEQKFLASFDNVNQLSESSASAAFNAQAAAHTAAAGAAEYNTAMRNAAEQTAQNTKPLAAELSALRNEVEFLNNELSLERKFRLEAETENMVYTKQMDKRNFKVAIVGAVCGVAGFIVAVVSLFLR